ncbi:MAG: ABC transporter permease [Pirellulales bacterium]|nr:ABC transporter permease [Pirellulales bacterium]
MMNNLAWGNLRNKLWSALGPLLALVVVVAVFALANQMQPGGGTFLRYRNFQSITNETAQLTVAALGMTLIIIAGGIDLSAGSIIALSSMVLALALQRDWPPSVAIAAAVLTGGLAGAGNGLLVSALRIVPFIVTLGTMTLYLGISKLLVPEGASEVLPGVEQVPAAFADFVATEPPAGWPISPSVCGAVLLAVLIGTLMRFTVLGRYIYAIGSNEPASILSGVPVPFWKILIYALGGMCFGLAGVYLFAEFGKGIPTAGQGMELAIITAVVVGGTSLSGGRGTVLGTVCGAAIMAVVGSGCVQLGLENRLRDIISGGIVIGAVAVDQWRSRWRG